MFTPYSRTKYVQRQTLRAFAAVVLMTTLTPATSAIAVSAGDKTCSPHVFWKLHRVSPRNFFLPRTRYIDGPGGSMTVSVTREHEVLAFIETENEKQHTLTTGDVVKSLRRLGLPHLEERHMVFSGHEYTREISDGMYGNMWYRVFGYRAGWSAWSVLDTCRHVKVAAGIANVPARVEGWRYWETKHPTYKNRQLSVH